MPAPTTAARDPDFLGPSQSRLAALAGFVDIPNRGSLEKRADPPATCGFVAEVRFGLGGSIRTEGRRRRAGPLTGGAFSAEHPLKRESRLGLGAGMEALACARTVKAIAAAIMLPLLSGCAGLHLDQEPNQVIQRTEGEDNYAQRQKAGPVAARVLPYALLAEQSYDSQVYLTRKATRRASACAADDPKDCAALADDRRAARWLEEWRYVWSCSGADECGGQTAGQGERVADGLGVQIWARKGVRCREAVIAFRGTIGGNRGDWESNFHWILRAFPIYDQYEQGRVRDFRRRPPARRGAGSARSLFRSAHPPRLRVRSLYGDRILFGRPAEPGSQRARTGDRARLRIRRSARLWPADHAAHHSLVPLQSACRQRPLSRLSRRSNRPPQPDRSGQRTASGRERLRTREIADGARAVRRDPETAAGRIAMRRSMLCPI